MIRQYLYIAALALLTMGCSAGRKMQAASILKQCKAEITGVSLQDIELDSLLFPALHGKSKDLLPNAAVLPMVQKLLNGQMERPLGVARLRITLQVRNASPDSLWLDALDGELALDTLLRTPLHMSAPALLKPGASELQVDASVPLDQKLFALSSVRQYRLSGMATAALQSDGSRVELEFDEKRPLPKEQVDQMLQSAKQALIEQVVSSWASSLM